ncbi:RidA family protein [Microbaculum marinisediminis]|uniref:RidA family protein n=1 Tax=Microbaculum marinisediminis TaxID=2931392 RepID=A0AAW5QWP6_9HYPH|nr:RidA family protein [Microbaculum sp. A6E488]MCT8972347.1 RidA family protein [Microbaculum sp. A6E488]
MSVTSLPAAADENDRPETLLPAGWPRPKGYSNGMKATGTVVVTGGVVGWDANEQFPDTFGAQIRQTLSNIREILAAGGAHPRHLVRLTWYVTDLDAYRANLKEVGRAYRDEIGPYFPAMAVVQVVGLVEPKAMIEIEATAVVPTDA